MANDPHEPHNVIGNILAAVGAIGILSAFAWWWFL
jgi:hypothetical protein